MCITVFVIKTVPLSAYLISNTKSPLAWIIAIWCVCILIFLGDFYSNEFYSVQRLMFLVLLYA